MNTPPQQFLAECETPDTIKRVSIIPAPLANTVSWVAGTDKGPSAIIEASQTLETFDDELHIETCKIGIDTLPSLNLAGLSSEQACRIISETVSTELQRDRLPVVLGGEHTVALPAVAACAKKHPNLHIVQVDAHLDLRDKYDGAALSHACVMRRIHDLRLPFTQVGIRSFSKEEWELVQTENWQPFFMDRIKKEPDWIEQVCSQCNGPVYLTFDVDGLDPSIMPATGTPEPNGLSWEAATALIRALARTKQIVGCDFVELAPQPGEHHAAFTVAKLIYRSLGYIFEPLLTKPSEAGLFSVPT